MAINFSDILANIGDFGRRNYQPGEAGGAPAFVREGDARSTRANLVDPAWSGVSGNAYTDTDTVGYRRNGAPNFTNTQKKRMYERDIGQASWLVKKAMDGDDYARLMFRDAMRGRFKEALSISDFPNLFGDIINRAVLANYQETPYTYNMIANIAQVSDFRNVKRFRVDGGNGLLAPLAADGTLIPVEPGAQYPEDKLTDGLYSYSVFKIGKRMPFLWETFINDDLNALRDVPARFGQGARRTREYFVTKLFANNTAFFSTANKNTVIPVGDYAATNPSLDITALAQAMTLMSMQVDTTGSPISIESMILMVPPSLKVAAQNILNADYFFANDFGGTNDGSGGSLMRLQVANWAKNIVKLAVNYYLPIADSTHGNTGWYLFSDPKNGRPAIEFGQLRGHETPEMWMKLANAVRIGEGSMGPGNALMQGTTPIGSAEGDFDTDSLHYKVRDVYGGTLMDPLMAMYSNGSKS